MVKKRMPLVQEFCLQRSRTSHQDSRQEESKPQYGITGKVGGMKSSPNNDEKGNIVSWTVTFAILEAAPLPGTQLAPNPLPPDVPVRITVEDDPVVFNSYIAEVLGVWNQKTNFFEAEEVRVPRLGIILRTIQGNWVVFLVFIAIFFIVLGVIVSNAR